MRIAHLSDIHFRGTQRHAEYERALKLLYKQLRDQNVEMIVATGDFFHTKTQNISPEVIDKLVGMFRGLCNVAPVIACLGNHDGNLANESRQDAISPIVEAMHLPNLYLYKKSGVYTHGNLNFCVFSCFDKEAWTNIKPAAQGINIALYHGPMTGCTTDNGTKILESEVDLDFFKPYDFAMLGDIHTHQYLDYRSHDGPTRELRPWIAYPGSLIQQNYGESEHKGYLLWDIGGKRRWTVEFVELANLAPYVTARWKGSVKDTLRGIIADRNSKAFIKDSRYRIVTTQNISQFEIKQLYYELKDKRGGTEVVIKNDSKINLQNIRTNTVDIQKTSLRNDPDALTKLYCEFVKDHANLSLPAEQLAEAKTIINEYIARLNQQESESTTRDVVWSIKNIEFDNLFRYGEGNRVDFTKLSGVVGIFGPNRVGKSSIVGALMYGLYNTTDRGSIKSAHIINRLKKQCRSMVLINVAGTDYVIVRQTVKNEAKRKQVVDEDKAQTTLSLWRVDPTGTMIDLANEQGDTRPDTDKIIRKLIGSAQDFLLTSFSNQGGINRFIEEGATQRKLILNRFLDLDIFEKLYKYVNDDCAALNARTGFYSNASWESTIFQTEKRVRAQEEQLKKLVEDLDSRRNSLDEFRLWLKQHETTSEMVTQTKQLEADLKGLEADMLPVLLNDRKSKLAEHKYWSKKLETTKLDIAKYDLVALAQKEEQLKALQARMHDSHTRLVQEEAVLAGQEKSIKKLTLVPCGDKYPTCRYIKDASKDKQLVEAQKELVKQLADSIQAWSAEAASLVKENVEKQLKTHAILVANVDKLESNLSVLDSGLKMLDMSITQTEATIKTKRQQLTELKKSLNVTETNEYKAKQKQYELCQKQVTELETSKNDLLLAIGKDRAKLDQLQKERQECQTLLNRYKIYDTILQAFSKNGIPAMVLKSQLPAINMELDRILSNAVDFKLSIETEVATNTLDIFVEDEHSRRLIELGSGMEKMICSLALRAALSNLSSLPKPDIFIVDEGFGSLDEDGLQKCMQLLSALKTQFKTILVITHVPQIKEIADHLIEIVNLGLESKVEV